MLWDKKKYLVFIKGGKGQFNTGKMRGCIEHLIVIPQTNTTVWRMSIVDSDGDVIYDKSHIGRLDDREGLPVGTAKQEICTVLFAEVNRNEPITVIFKVREA